MSEKCSFVTSDLLTAIQNHEFDHIFIIANYANFLKGNLFYENNPDSLNIFKEQIISLPVSQRDKVVIVGQFPIWKNNLPNILASKVYTNKKIEDYGKVTLNSETFLIENDIKNWANKNNIKYFSILDILCINESCLQFIEINNTKYSTSFDSIHFSKEVSIYVSKIIETKLNS